MSGGGLNPSRMFGAKGFVGVTAGSMPLLDPFHRLLIAGAYWRGKAGRLNRKGVTMLWTDHSGLAQAPVLVRRWLLGLFVALRVCSVQVHAGTCGSRTADEQRSRLAVNPPSLVAVRITRSA